MVYPNCDELTSKLAIFLNNSVLLATQGDNGEQNRRTVTGDGHWKDYSECPTLPSQRSLILRGEMDGFSFCEWNEFQDHGKALMADVLIAWKLTQVRLHAKVDEWIT